MVHISDPMERILAEAMSLAGINYEHETSGATPLDFYLPPAVHIEVKQFHSPRIAAQMARADNVIAVQGRGAVEWLAKLLTDNYHLARELRDTTEALVAARQSPIPPDPIEG